MTAKTTLHGVSCEKTKAMCKDLRKRGFKWHLDDNGNDGFIINTFINGRDFAISMVNSVYCKSFSRGFHKWQKFDDVDQLVLATISKADSKPSEKQVNYLDYLSKTSGIDLTDSYPKTVTEAANKINELKDLIKAK